MNTDADSKIRFEYDCNLWLHTVIVTILPRRAGLYYRECEHTSKSTKHRLNKHGGRAAPLFHNQDGICIPEYESTISLLFGSLV